MAKICIILLLIIAILVSAGLSLPSALMWVFLGPLIVGLAVVLIAGSVIGMCNLVERWRS